MSTIDNFLHLVALSRKSSEYRPSLTASDGTYDRHDAQEQQDPMRAVQPGERNLWPSCSPAIEMAMQNEGLGYEQDKSEKQPYTDHCVHPPEFSHPESIPEIEPPCHVEAGQTNHRDGAPSLPNEAVLDRLEGLERTLTKVAMAHRWEHHRSGHRDPANPDDDSHNMQHAGDDDVRHGDPSGGDHTGSVNS